MSLQDQRVVIAAGASGIGLASASAQAPAPAGARQRPRPGLLSPEPALRLVSRRPAPQGR